MNLHRSQVAKNINLELLSELIEGACQEEGYIVKRFEDSETFTSAYRGIYITDTEGRLFIVTLDERTTAAEREINRP